VIESWLSCKVHSIIVAVNFPECCYDVDVQHCLSNANCDGYAACYNLRAAGTVDSDIASVVSITCTPETVSTVEGRAQCNAVCLHQRCCLHGGKCGLIALRLGFSGH